MAAAPPIYYELLTREEYYYTECRREENIKYNQAVYTRIAYIQLRQDVAKKATDILLNVVHPSLHTHLEKVMPDTNNIPGWFEYLMTIKLTTPNAIQGFFGDFECTVNLFLVMLLSEHENNDLYEGVDDVKSAQAVVKKYKDLLTGTLKSAFLAEACSLYLTPSFRPWMELGCARKHRFHTS
ncbi:hypothetical protein THRCLA_09970 [Thraustotheca clavata]|uniref:Uncharacterized protein n=1 Tax=Thraustotheca clavata TaxID=74557 RepID=A0A1V9YTE3_9STRA|nr:hypothetical protein THRCLA_09970 [Thraustotheca clavata]